MATTLNKESQPGAPVSPMLPPQDGYMFQDKAKFPTSFVADVGAETTAFWADFQVVGRGVSQWQNYRTGVEDQA